MPIDKTVCELFAGVGGFRVGFNFIGGKETQDWNFIYANQFEPSRKSQHAYQCYISHFKDGNHSNKDINDAIQEKELPEHFSLLVGGFPCQDYSVASTQAKGIQGKKGVLWWNIYEIARDHNPPFILLENVDRLLKSPAKQRGRDFGIILGCLNQLGYSVEWRVINAADYGNPQRRRRVFIFAFRNNTNYAQQLLKSESLKAWIHEQGFFPKQFRVHPSDIIPIVEAGKELDANINNISKYFKYEFRNAGVMRNGIIYTENVIPISEQEKTLSEILEKDVEEKYYLTDSVLAKWKYMKGAKRETRTTNDGYEYQYTEGAIPFPDPINKSARTMLTSEGSKNRSSHVIEDPQTKRLRILTPLECERLNGFPDNWTDTGMPYKFRYFCMGNALVVELVRRMRFTLDTIFAEENLENKLESDEAAVTE